MTTQEKLEKVWEEDYIKSLPEFIRERGFVYCKNEQQKDILITGINPSFRDGDSTDSYGFHFDRKTFDKWDRYFGPIGKILNNGNGIDLIDKTAYIDIFYYREKVQRLLSKKILKCDGGIPFLVDQLKITQHTIEEIIKPKLIIVKNKESAAYWGRMKDQGIIWMGYEFRHIEDMNCGELCEIIGFVDSPERIGDIKKTNLIGSLILFSKHICQFTKKEERPTAEIISNLLERCK